MVRRLCRLVRRADPVAAVAAVVLVIGAAQLFAGALAAGVTIDEPTHVHRLTTWLDNGWYVVNTTQIDGEAEPTSSPYVYGPAYAALAHGANVLVGNESLGEVSHSDAAYEARHLTVAALALLATVAVGAAVWRLSGSRRFGLWAAAGLLAMPAWTGHAFFNPKDIPVACGYSLVTVALILALTESRGGGASTRWRLAIGVMLAAGIFIGAGTRLALWVPFAASIVTYAAVRLGQRRLGGIAGDPRTNLAVAAGAGAGLGGITVLYPNVAGKPATLLAESVSGSSEYPVTSITLTAGELLSEHPPWWYLPIWIGASVPLLLGALALVGAALGIWALARGSGTDWRRVVWRRPQLGLVLVLGQALLLPLSAVITGAVMYNGMRQHLYVLPAIAILAGVGAHGLWSWASARRSEIPWRGIAIGLLGATLLVPTAEQTLLFPYNYAYVNPVAGIGGVNNRWETDYWFASGPEALSRTPRTASLLCSSALVLPGDDDGRPELVPCGSDFFTPSEARRGDDVKEGRPGDGSAVWVIAKTRGANRPPHYCEDAANVTRWLRGERVLMSFVLRCDRREAQRDVED